MKIFCLVLALAAVIDAGAATNYCDKSLCINGKHIACGHNGKFDATCPKDAAMVKIDQKLKKAMLDTFNELRNRIAGGDEPGFRPACRMGTVQWDDELAKFAELNVKQCKGEHDPCHNTKIYELSSQNLFWQPFNGKIDNLATLQNSIRSWYAEVKDSNAAEIRKVTPDGPMTGHFLNVVLENNVRVGCAASTYTDSSRYSSYLVACNFATGYMGGSTVYFDCDVPAKECKSGRNPQYKNLCSTSEKYNYDFNWLDEKH